MIGLCETWLKPNTFLPLIEASPPDYNYTLTAWASKQGGCVALIYKSIFSLGSNRVIELTSSEALVLKPSSSNSNSLVQGTGFHLVVLYRPLRPYTQFLEEFGEFIADLVTRSDKILIIGDFNIHLNKPSDPLGKAFLRLPDISNFSQLVHEPTHSSGNTLDLIISHGLDVSALNIASVSSAVSDHSLITMEASSACPYVSDTNVLTSRHNSPTITAMLSGKVPGVLAPFVTVIKPVKSLTNKVNSLLVSLLDSVALVSTKTRRPKKSTPWFTDETRDLKHACRNMERAWHKSKLVIFYLVWRDSVLNYKHALNTARTAYFSGLINNNKHNPRFLLKITVSV